MHIKTNNTDNKMATKRQLLSADCLEECFVSFDMCFHSSAAFKY